MEFTKDDLKDGMLLEYGQGFDQIGVIHDGKVHYLNGGHPEDINESIFKPEYPDEYPVTKITYGGKVVFEREEWYELSIDEVFELLKSGPVQGQAYCAHKEVWATIELQDLRPWSKCRYLAAAKQYRKFRIKK